MVRFLAELRHPAKPEIEAVRALVLGADRCLLTLADETAVRAQRKAVAAIVRQWIRWV